jgi:hypothetical protein
MSPADEDTLFLPFLSGCLSFPIPASYPDRPAMVAGSGGADVLLATHLRGALTLSSWSVLFTVESSCVSLFIFLCVPSLLKL